jgi:hypothetical protein
VKATYASGYVARRFVDWSVCSRFKRTMGIGVLTQSGAWGGISDRVQRGWRGKAANWRVRAGRPKRLLSVDPAESSRGRWGPQAMRRRRSLAPSAPPCPHRSGGASRPQSPRTYLGGWPVVGMRGDRAASSPGGRRAGDQARRQWRATMRSSPDQIGPRRPRRAR